MKRRLILLSIILIPFIAIGIACWHRYPKSDCYTTEDVLKLFTGDSAHTALAKESGQTINAPQKRFWWPKSGKYKVLSANITPKGDVFENLLWVEYLPDSTHYPIQIETGGEMNCRVGTIINVKLSPSGGTIVESAD